jgi:transcriptional regulator with XRE-family HTH domain
MRADRTVMAERTIMKPKVSRYLKNQIAEMRLGQESKPILATIKLQNNCLRARRVALGLSSREIAARIGISYLSYLRLENMRQSPLGVRAGEHWRENAKKLANFYRVLPENLFPQVVLEVDKPVTSREFDESEIQSLLPDYMRREALGPEEVMSRNQLRGAVTKTLRSLKPMEIEVVKRHYGLDTGIGRTVNQVGREIGRSGTRVKQIRDIAIRKLGSLVPASMSLPILAPNDLGEGVRCIYHNLGEIDEPPDPSIPFTMNVLLYMPDPDDKGLEMLRFQGKQVGILEQAADLGGLSVHPRLLKIMIVSPDGNVQRLKGGAKAPWIFPPSRAGHS